MTGAWRDDPLTVAVARLVAVLLIVTRARLIVRWLAGKLGPREEGTK